MNSTSRAFDRFGLGGRPGERQRVGDPRGWLAAAQLDGGPPTLGRGDLPTTVDVARAQVALRQAAGSRDDGARGEARRKLREVQLRELRASLGERLTSERPFVERLVALALAHGRA